MPLVQSSSFTFCPPPSLSNRSSRRYLKFYQNNLWFNLILYPRRHSLKVNCPSWSASNALKMTLQLPQQNQSIPQHCCIWLLSVIPEYSFDIVVKIIVLKDIAAQFLLQTRKVSLLSFHSTKKLWLCLPKYLQHTIPHLKPCRVRRILEGSGVCLLRHTHCKVRPARQMIML